MLNSYQFRAPVLGKIRLGVKKIAASGKEYPTNVDYFVLDDGLPPDIRAAIIERYGEDPKELDIMFVSNEIEDNIPTWYKWYTSAKKNDRGEIIGGRLRCYGDGPHLDGTPGTAVHLEKRDPITRLAPQRPCMGESCPDFFDQNRRQQCAQTMQVFCMLPLISFDGVFEIDTRSKYSMGNFANQLNWSMRIYEGKIAFQPFQIYREEEVITFMDPQGNQKTSTHAIMKLRDNRKNSDKLGPEIKRLHAAVQGMQILLPSRDELVERPNGLAFALDPAEEVAEEKKLIASKILSAEDLLKDADIVAGFEKLEALHGKAFDSKARLISIRKREGSADWKGAVLEALNEQIAKAEERKQQQAAAAQPPVENPPESSPQTDAVM